MLRTIVVRNQLVTNAVKKTIWSNIVRCLSTELTRRKQNNLTSSQPKLLAPSQWSIQKRHYASLPEHSKITLPALSPTMETGSIVRWEKKEGDKLSEGDLLCEIETDKATMGFETPEEGYLAKVLIPEGTKGVPVGKLLCIIVENQADVAAFKDFKDDGAVAAPAPKAAAPPAAAAPPPPAAPAPAPARAAAPAPAVAAAPAPSPGSRIMASPLAKRLAEIRNVRLGGTGSGLYGSLKSGDISAAAGAPAAAAGAPAPAPAPGASFVDIPLTGMRETIAKRLTASKQTVPHYQLSVTVNIDKTLAMRVAINKQLEKKGVKISVNDFIIKALAAACKRVPTVNSHWMDTYIRQFSNVDVSVAVATPTGLITPIVFNADSRGIIEISKDMKALAAKAKEGKLQPQEYQGGTVCVSNLGMFGITMFNAIINPPQSLILACGGVQEMVIASESAEKGFRTAKFVTFTASADHRVIDGAVGAEWMKEFKLNMEDPANMIL